MDRLVDIVVASPGRLLQHHHQHNVYLSHIHTVIIDEVDTMLMQGFGGDVRGVLKTVMQNKREG
ncbi:DEAD/DEAH box helicase, partial [archaeon]